jgi:hypothetical protein
LRENRETLLKFSEKKEKIEEDGKS